MTKHSKNNTASSTFSYAEYKKLDYGTKRKRLGNESMRRFDACALCLQSAREPLVCDQGHLFCKECVYTDLLTQRKDIKRQKERLEALKREAEAAKARAMEAARARVRADFERAQLGLAPKMGNEVATTSGAPSDSNKGDGDKGEAPHGTKRKLSASTIDELAAEAEQVALRQIEREQAAALRHQLPDFWLPSLTPTYTASATAAGGPTSLKDVKLQTTCRGGEPPHPVSLKTLIPIKFTFLSNPRSADTSSASPAGGNQSKKDDEQTPICPSCKKAFSNSTLMFATKPCAHVTCKTCSDTLVRPAKQCVVCDTPLGDGDLIGLKREGTGFAGGGMAETSKKGVAFQG